jgi:hypothetical protein
VLCQLGHCPKEKAASRQSRSKALLANMVAGGCGPDFWEMDLPQGGLLVIGSEGVDYFRDRESYDRDAGYHPDDSLMFANMILTNNTTPGVTGREKDGCDGNDNNMS